MPSDLINLGRKIITQFPAEINVNLNDIRRITMSLIYLFYVQCQSQQRKRVSFAIVVINSLKGTDGTLNQTLRILPN